MRKIILITVSLFTAAATRAQSSSFWPQQLAPKAIVTCNISNFSNLAELNLAQSISGLAAKAINNKTNTEGVWVESRIEPYETYYRSLVKRLKLQETGVYNVWQLVRRFKASGVIKGYVLYNTGRKDNSVNLATVYAGLTNGVLIDQSQEQQAISAGLSKLKDVTRSTFDLQLFTALAPHLSKDLLVVASPAFANNRDYAIAHNSLIYYGVDSLYFKMLDWVTPLSPVIGWNQGDEFKQIEPCSSRGLINVPADWCQNLAMLTVASADPLPKIKSYSPGKIDKDDTKSYLALVMSDGDNLQWTMNQFLTSQQYWNNPQNSAVPMSFTTCIFNLGLAVPDVYRQLAITQQAGTSLVEYGGGYYYPDLFGRLSGHGAELLRRHARRINRQLKLSGVKVFGFICRKINSPEALTAYQIFAEELDDITGMIAVQYAPYNGGKGQVFWLKNKKGIEIPVISARYQLWANQKGTATGNPAKLADIINQDDEKQPGLDWAVVHAWSMFKGPSVDVPDTFRKATPGERGVTPVMWTKERLNKSIRVVGIEELLWRLRLAHQVSASPKK